MTAGLPQASPRPSAQSQTVYLQKFSGNLGNAGGLYHGRTTLPLCETGGFILVRVNTAKLFPVGVKDTDEVMVMFAATIFAERCLALNSSFCHVTHSIGREYLLHYRRRASAPQVPEKIVSRTSLHRGNACRRAGDFAENRQNVAAKNLDRFASGAGKAVKMHRWWATTLGLPGTSNSSAFVLKCYRPWGGWNSRANLSRKSLRVTKHFPILNVFTCEEKIS
jgi:hypothetical protein